MEQARTRGHFPGTHCQQCVMGSNFGKTEVRRVESVQKPYECSFFRY